MNWLPISTAPKEGPILLAWPDKEAGYWYIVIGEWRKPFLIREAGWYGHGNTTPSKPTMWCQIVTPEAHQRLTVIEGGKV